ncbi:transcription-repair coupling factor [Thermomicrobium sp. 4228-Ro]|uniref:transcription-repair coupling factor n=1 Tax=Thermomicrobium sp. 4228-Ro TaxID=2993937 RepID=UPI0022498017|nr:transcription-repair coupling factor [Thermomicrobium sp. 4228-Ro]MCX2726215.1 transcription-repair coupling factor [Thermomicrobium sp. 4228-Ro]
MALQAVVRRIAQTRSFQAVSTQITSGRSATIEGLPAAARPWVVAALALELHRPLLLIVPRQIHADEFAETIGQLVPQVPVMTWPAPETLPYDIFTHDRPTAADRSWFLERLASNHPTIAIVPARGLTELLPPAGALRDQRLLLKPGTRLTPERLVNHLLASGYALSPLVQQPGSYSRRAGIVDFWPPGTEQAIRVEFFGDEVDSLRAFDPVTQRTVSRLDTVTILPVSDVPIASYREAAAHLRALDLSTLRPEVVAEWQRLCDRLERGQLVPAPELVRPFVFPAAASLLDYLGPGSSVVVIDPGAVHLALEQFERQAEELREASEQSGELPFGLPRPYHPAESVWRALTEHATLWLGTTTAVEQTPDGSATCIGFSTSVPTLGGRLNALLEQLGPFRDAGYAIVLVTEQPDRLTQVLEEHRLDAHRGDSANGAIAIERGRLSGGWGHEEARLLLLTDRELFGLRRFPRSPQRRRASVSSGDLLSRLVPGAYVVHVDHGIARYGGLVSLTINGVHREYLLLEYADNDRLYLPVDQLDRITLYESFDGEPKLTRLGSPEWSRIKRRVREAVRELAFELLQLYAAREATPGIAFGPDTPWDRELEESFPYEETPDQLRAIQEVKADMESPRPMDRLLCGDVGFGKTEVALRAAFKAVNNGYQVAVLVPTTVLALQHYETFRERLAPYPVRVEMLSRLRPKSEQREIVQGIRDGTVDIVIGTHRLLQRDVQFKRLGLVIIDEEHRFGVAQKEHFKRLRTNIDVLAMTATPIPRTLYLALSGLRDLSVIATPPVERTPVRTFVTPARDCVIREAILRELSRGGQVYVVHNRVQSIQRFAEHLQTLVPEARIAVAHGQMPEAELERIIIAFIEKEFDVLVCTAIIESGIDIPSVNTIIIDRADQLGLTQLYQLRGRVGRRHIRAYAYLLYDDRRPLSPEAQARLEAIQEATELGAGFQIALRDLEIRGAGNILGPEQSGHIAAVGLELYTQLLARAVQEIREGRPIDEPPSVTVDLPLDATIPPEYCGDEAVRMSLYQRFAALRTATELNDLVAELRDRFGPLPEPVQRLADLAALRIWANRLGLASILERDGEVYIRPVVGARLDRERLRRLVGSGVYVTPNQVRLVLARLEVPLWEAVQAVLREIETRRATVLLGAPLPERSASTR